MSRRKRVYSILTVLLTALTVSLMYYKIKLDYIASVQYSQQYSAYDSTADSEYIGYIFDDYNKRVNLGYVDKMEGEDEDNSNPVSSSSYGDLADEETKESVRAIRSEKIIKERAEE